jgi:hypothetical protein
VFVQSSIEGSLDLDHHLFLWNSASSSATVSGSIGTI